MNNVIDMPTALKLIREDFDMDLVEHVELLWSLQTCRDALRLCAISGGGNFDEFTMSNVYATLESAEKSIEYAEKYRRSIGRR